MSWRRKGARAGRLSIGARLALGYTLSAFGMLACITTFQYWILNRGLEWDERQIVLNKIKMFEATLHRHGDNAAFLDHEVNLEGGAYWPGQHYIVYSRILDEAGRVIIETPGMDGLIPQVSFPEPAGTARDLPMGIVHYREAANGHSYFLMSAWARSGGADGPRRLIQVAMDDTDERDMIAGYRRDTLLALLLGTLLFGLAGTFIARRCLRPVHDLTRAAGRITANSALQDVDLDTPDWPDELRALARSLHDMALRLTAALQRCSRCAEDIAHELRNPIHTLMGGAEVALAKPRTAEEYRQLLEASLEEYGRLSRMINELLFIARADNPHTAIDRRRLDVRGELEAVREFYEAQAREQGVTIRCAGQAGIDADPLLLRHAVSNLVANALHHTPRGGRISLAVSQPGGSGATEIAISDTGCGIESEDLPRVFDRYFRTEQRSRRRGEGAGLGLAIVKSVMALHGGDVGVESERGKGTTFVLRFPAATRPATERTRPVARELPAAPVREP